LAEVHPWDVSPAEAIAIQRELAGRVIRSGGPDPESVRYIAGVDISAGKVGTTGRSAVVLLSYPDLEVVEVSRHEQELRFPYVPGLLSFREIPIIRGAYERLSRLPDLVIVDGQGIAHPRRLGLAAHLGLLIDRPTIGCAKSVLTGRYEDPPDEAGACTPLRAGGEVIGNAVRTRPGVKPVFISIGHRIGLDEATAWILRCTRRYRLPEPIRAAHNHAGLKME
jgi:deoxyribonuclease V